MDRTEINYEEMAEKFKIDAEWAEAQDLEIPTCLMNDLRQASDAISELVKMAEKKEKLARSYREKWHQSVEDFAQLIHELDPVKRGRDAEPKGEAK